MMTKRLFARPLAVGCALLVAGCAVGPDYQRPTTETPAAFKEAGRWQPVDGDASPFVAPARWWEVFNDPTLNAIVAQVALDNQNLKAAEAQYRAARAAFDAAAAPLLPALSATGGATRGNTGVPGVLMTSDTVTASASWELDLWGRIRRTAESARATMDASAADLAAAQLSAQALAAQTYLQLRAAERQTQLFATTTGAYQRFLALTQHRLAAGVASPLDVAQAQTQLAAAQTQQLDAANQRAQLEHALAVLLGRAPAAWSLAPTGVLPTVPPAPQLLPSTLLITRPDIAAAERRLAAANAQIGVAKAAFFPVVSLAASGGYRSSGLANLFSAPNQIWSLGPSAVLSLFDGGARSAAVAQARAGYDQALANYRQTVLTAFQEVEDNLAALQLLEQQSEAGDRAWAAARKSREIAQHQYQAGVGSALTVITAQTAELSAEQTLIALYSRRAQAAVTLLKNAGGRWRDDAAGP